MDRALVIKHLTQADRHVATGEHHIARQRQLISELTRAGHDTRRALELLSMFEQTQTMHVAHRDWLRAQLPETFLQCHQGGHK